MVPGPGDVEVRTSRAEIYFTAFFMHHYWLGTVLVSRKRAGGKNPILQGDTEADTGWAQVLADIFFTRARGQRKNCDLTRQNIHEPVHRNIGDSQDTEKHVFPHNLIFPCEEPRPSPGSSPTSRSLACRLGSRLTHKPMQK